jgi:excisionase family DNA binding protein
MEEKRFLDVNGLADYIHMSESYVYKMVSKNSIPHIKLGTRTRFGLVPSHKKRNEHPRYAFMERDSPDTIPEHLPGLSYY